ncbi:ethanolamine ammonia-lyase subunit EutC [Beijerinckia sp. L45]|uniref:ethanolamine ammonia-lyase subunit EutC n=1 Tax=Beijerinckia sp. L45 TaxID=1641855 RepID=UPI00131EA5B6|nr:ethanolamine ammonia-lyase subunit EutC [Beijerinckia sp. L45]
MSVEDDQTVPKTSEARGLDPWARLRRSTAARIGLGRAGDTMPLRPVLDFQLAHAEARDAVHAALDVEALATALAPQQTITVRSAVPDRSLYLRRPDLGRSLDPASRAPLEAAAGPYDCVFVIADGLSAVAVQSHAVPLLARCLPRLKMLSIAPIVIATQARVALGDAVGESLEARLCVVLIGERPGLSVADSLGAYITFDPKTGRRDSERNCISNIHTKGGLDYEPAAQKLCWLIEQALSRGVTGIALKDDHGAPLLPGQPTA